MVLVSILVIIFVIILIIGGLIASIYFHHHGVVVRLQNEKREARGDVMEPDDVEKMRREIMTDASVQAMFQAVFGRAWEAEVGGGPQITVWFTDYDEENQLRYCQYTKLFEDHDEYKQWQTSDPYVDKSTCPHLTEDEVPQWVKNKLNKKVQEAEAQARAQAKRRRLRVWW